MKKALITGISGQDGSLLADSLLDQGYEVLAISHHDLGVNDLKIKNYSHFLDAIKWKKVSLEDSSSLMNFLSQHTPDEVYHFGAQSFPSAGFDDNYGAFNANVQGTYNLLSCVFKVNSNAKFFFAGSSEIFGDNPNKVMNEDERFFPKTMYGISKLAGHELIRNYRENLKRFTVTGFLFNHESQRRGEEFVTRKITSTAAKIKLGLQKNLTLGSLDTQRDWSAAEDFVKGFQLALRHEKAQDYVFSSGKLHTIREFAELSFKVLGLNAEDYITIDPKFNRPAAYSLEGDSSRAKNELGWKPKISFESMIEKMVRSDFDRYSKTI